MHQPPIRLKDLTDSYLTNSKVETASIALKANDFSDNGLIKANFNSHLTQIQSNSSQISSLLTTLKTTNSNLSGVANDVHDINLWKARITNEYRLETFDYSKFYIYMLIILEPLY